MKLTKSTLGLLKQAESNMNEIFECTEVPFEQCQKSIEEIRDLAEGLLQGLKMEEKHNEHK